jgi:predicted enzyme related to lactoylglutathione lyase
MELGMYVAVSDLTTSKAFYANLLSARPYVENENFVGFELAGGRFGLMKASAYTFPMTRGNNVVPNIRVSDIQAAFEHVKSLHPSKMQDSIMDLGAMKLFMFADPDGNVIEFHSIAPARDAS